MNGTFQNYNPIRRFLDGQIPFLDFYDYLGLGHMYSGVFVSLFMGNTYQDSLVIFEFLTIICFSLFSLVIGKCILKKYITASIFTISILFATMNFESFGSLNDLRSVLTPGNSARLIRGMCLPLSTIIFLLCVKNWALIKKLLSKLNDSEIIAILVGITSGISILWSNDYGFSAVGAITLLAAVQFILTLHNNKLKKREICIAYIKYTAIFSFSMIISFFIFGEILTYGNLHNWLKITIGIGQYQNWYYNSGPNFYIYNLDLSSATVLQILVSIYYIISYQKKGWSLSTVERYVIPAFLNITCVVAVQQYKLFSGGYNYQVAYTVLFITIFYEFCNFLGKQLQINMSEKRLRQFLIGALIIAVALPCHKIYKEIKEERKPHIGIHIKELDGYLTKYGNELKTTKNLLKDKVFFSEYATAQEVVNNTYQPSGYDYIIHVLGDQQREQYLKTFKTLNIDYAITVNKNVNPYTYWAERANWFWFRELYKNWQQVYKNQLEVVWKKSDKPNTIKGKFDVKITKQNHNSYELSLDLNEKITGFADVLIDYKVSRRSRLSSFFVIKTVLKVQNQKNIECPSFYREYDLNKYERAFYESNFLRPFGREYIPLKIVNGKGSILVTSQPEKNTNLTIHEVKCDEIIIEKKL